MGVGEGGGELGDCGNTPCNTNVRNQHSDNWGGLKITPTPYMLEGAIRSLLYARSSLRSSDAKEPCFEAMHHIWNTLQNTPPELLSCATEKGGGLR